MVTLHNMPGQSYPAEYRLTKLVNLDWSHEISYIIELGPELAKLSKPLQKRWVRQKIEKEYGSPIKNPTQKRYIWEPYFSETSNLSELAKDALYSSWKVTVKEPGEI